MTDRFSFSSSAARDPGARTSSASRVEGRRTLPAGRVVVVIATCLLTWVLLDAPSLKRASEAQPIGARRSASLFVLRPLAAISDATRLGTVVGAIRRIAGDRGSVQAAAPEPLPVGPAPTAAARPPSRTTPIQTPTTANRLRVVVVGDSLAQGLGIYLERVMRPSLAVVSSQGVISSGLARPDYYDWLHRMHHIENVFHPDLVIVMLGENDAQDLLTAQGRLDTQIGTAAWPVSYGRRVQQLVKIAVDSGSHAVWVGLPVVQNRGRWGYIRSVDGIYQDVVEQIPNAAFLDTWPMFTTRDGRYAVYTRVDGRIVQVREPDGVHFTPAGYTTIARAAIGVAERSFGLSTKVTTEP